MKSILKNPFFIAIFSCVLLTPIGNSIYDHTKNIPILTNFVLRPLSYLWGAIISVLAFKVAVWIILLAILIWIILNPLFREQLSSKNKLDNNPDVPSAVKQPDFLNYRKDILKKWLWKWSYKKSTSGGYSIDELWPHCVLDETPLVQQLDYLICPRCDKHYGDRYYSDQYSMMEDVQTIGVLIEDNINKGNFKID